MIQAWRVGGSKFFLMTQQPIQIHGFSGAEFRGEHFAAKKIVLHPGGTLPYHQFSEKFHFCEKLIFD